MAGSAAGAVAKVSSGLECVGDVAWGSHFCQFYKTGHDLLDMLVPYFKAGIENHERCLWVASEPFKAHEARAALREAVPADLPDLERAGQVTLLNHDEWYARSGAGDARSVLQAWQRAEEEALARGLRGLRLTGNTYWLERQDWDSFDDYESRVTECFHGRSIIGICSYCTGKVHSEGMIDVVRNHEFALIRRHGEWEMMESSALGIAKAELQELNAELERRVTQRTTELETMLRIRDEFLSIASHELKTPVAALKLFVDGILRANRSGSLSPEELNRRLLRADQQCKRLDVLITRLLDVSKSSDGRFSLSVDDVDFSEVARATAEQLRGEVEARGGRLALDVPAGLTGRTDAMRFGQMVTNLLSNAAKHAPGAKVELKLVEQGDQVLLAVKDGGPGIPLAEHARIFDRFVRGANGDYSTGFGLGLWVVREAANALGGFAGVTSQPGRGSTFTVILPRQPAA